jgi:hypothetical protein
MEIDSHFIKCLEMVQQDEHGWHQTGTFPCLVADMPPPYVDRLEKQDRLTLAVRSICQHESNMLTAIERLDWMRLEAPLNKHIDLWWRYYAGADIEFWYVNFRSLLDQVADVIVLDASLPSALRSFRKIYERTRPDKLRETGGARLAGSMGNGWLTLVQSAVWFPQILAARDGIVHLGGSAMVFGDASKGILFQVHGRRYHNLVGNQTFMYNSNVVMFDRYAASLTCHLVIFLEDFSRALYRSLGKSPRFHLSPRTYHPGWGTLSAWANAALATLGV